MKTQIKTEKKQKSYRVKEGDVLYCMPFILKYVLEKYLAIVDETITTPVADWYQSLDDDRKALIAIIRLENEG